MKKRVRNKNHKLLIKKKNSPWIILNSDRFLLSVLLFAIAVVGLFIINQPVSQEQFSGNAELASANFPTSQEVWDGIKTFLTTNLSFLGNDLTEIFISLIIVLIIFAAVYDMLELTSIFQNDWTQRLIAIGIALIAVILKWPLVITRWGLDFAAYLGVFGILYEIIIAIVIFIGLMFGNTWLAKFAVKRKGQVEQIKAIKGANQASAAITALRTLDKNFRKP